MDPTSFGLGPSSGSLQLSLAKVLLILKHSVRLRPNLLCGGVTDCADFGRCKVYKLGYIRLPCMLSSNCL